MSPPHRSSLPPVLSSHAPPESSPQRPPPRSIRISVTDRCDLSCLYCVPDHAVGALRASQRLDDDAIVEVVRTLVREGTRRVRLTGGEPLLRPSIVKLVGKLAQLGLQDLALTTNGTLLERMAGPLANAGLKRLNVSLDSLDPDRFALMTGGGSLQRVLRGIEAARGAGFENIGLNIVLVRGINDHEAGALVDFAWDYGLVPRFIELMKVGGGAGLAPSALVTAQETLERLNGRVPGPLSAARADSGRGPARYREAADGSGRRVGFITGSSHTFCGECDRLRLTADGKFRPCLASNEAVDIACAARQRDEHEIRRALATAWSRKPDASLWQGCNEQSAADVDMTTTGG